MIDRLHVEHVRHGGAAGIVPGPFAERAFHVALVRLDEAFEHDLGVGGKGQAGDAAAHHLHRPPAQAADDVELEHAIGRLHAAIEERERIAAQHHHDRHLLAAREIFLAVDIAVMARRHDEADALLVVHLRAIGPGVEPVLLGIARDAVGAGADIAPAVLLVPDGRREFLDIDILAQHHVLEHRPVGHDLVRHEARRLQIGLAIGLAQLPFVQVVGKAHRHVAARAGEDVEEHAETLGAARDVVEHDARAVLGAQDRLGGEPDILLPRRARDIAHLAQTPRIVEPLAQIVILDPPLDVAAAAAAAAHAPAFPLPAPIFAPPANRASPSDTEANPLPSGERVG